MNIKEYIPSYDESYTLVFDAEWSDFEENGWIMIFEKEGLYYTAEGGYCVMASLEDNNKESTLELISEQDALTEMLLWAEYETIF